MSAVTFASNGSITIGGANATTTVTALTTPTINLTIPP